MGETIEDASIRDLDRLYEIEAECFREEAFTKEQIAELLRDYNSISFVARVHERIVGFVIGVIYAERHTLHGHILTIEVLPRYRRRGIGQKLLGKIESILAQNGVRVSTLEVREDNIPAINLYRKMGYEILGTLKNYYGEVNGVYLRKLLF